MLQVFPEAPGRGAGGAEEGCSPPSQRKLQLQRAGVSSPSPALLRPGRGAVGTPPPFQGPANFVKATSHLGEVPQLVQGHTARRAGPVITDQIRCSRPPGAQPSPHHGAVCRRDAGCQARPVQDPPQPRGHAASSLPPRPGAGTEQGWAGQSSCCPGSQVDHPRGLGTPDRAPGGRASRGGGAEACASQSSFSSLMNGCNVCHAAADASFRVHS